MLKNKLSTDIKFFGVEVVEQVICIHFVSTAFFVALLVVIHKVLPLNDKDVGMCCNEGPNI